MMSSISSLADLYWSMKRSSRLAYSNRKRKSTLIANQANKQPYWDSLPTSCRVGLWQLHSRNLTKVLSTGRNTSLVIFSGGPDCLRGDAPVCFWCGSGWGRQQWWGDTWHSQKLDCLNKTFSSQVRNGWHTCCSNLSFFTKMYQQLCHPCLLEHNTFHSMCAHCRK